MDITQKAKKIKLLILDVDGVMTDGKIVYSDSGEELKFFDSRDGHGLKMLMRTGIDVAIITGRMSKAVEHRAANLDIGMVYQKALNKLEAYEEIVARKCLSDQEICAVGDDLPDVCRAQFVAMMRAFHVVHSSSSDGLSRFRSTAGPAQV